MSKCQWIMDGAPCESAGERRGVVVDLSGNPHNPWLCRTHELAVMRLSQEDAHDVLFAYAFAPPSAKGPWRGACQLCGERRMLAVAGTNPLRGHAVDHRFCVACLRLFLASLKLIGVTLLEEVKP